MFRLNWVTGLQTSLLYDKHGEGKKEEYEYLQLGSYGTGGYYNVHQVGNTHSLVDSTTILTSDWWRAPQYSPLIGGEHYNTHL